MWNSGSRKVSESMSQNLQRKSNAMRYVPVVLVIIPKDQAITAILARFHLIKSVTKWAQRVNKIHSKEEKRSQRINIWFHLIKLLGCQGPDNLKKLVEMVISLK